MPVQLPIPAYPDYTITPQGQVFYKGQIKKHSCKPGRSVKIRIKIKGTTRELGLAKVLAETFLPNPHGHTRIIFKDGNNHHCSLDNIRWVSNREYVRHNLFPGKSWEIKAKPPKPKGSIPCLAVPADPAAVAVPGFPGYYITPQGHCYHHSRLLRPYDLSGKKSLCVLLKNKESKKYLGLAKLLATMFIPNPCGHTRIIFRDRDNRNCTVANIAWVSDKEYNHYTCRSRSHCLPGTIMEKIDEDAKPIPGYPGYAITPAAKVYYQNRLLSTLKSRNRCDRVKLRNEQGKQVRVAVAKLIALVFIPNPHQHPKIIFKDRDCNNCSVDNIQWVSFSDWCRFVNRSVENADLLGQPKPKKEKPEVWIDPERMEMPDFPGHYISPSGIVYRGDKIIKPNSRRGHAPTIRMKIGGLRRYFGLATLVAEHFVPNPRHYKRIIFKDRDNQHCKASNIAWVDQETYTYYCTAHKGGKKLVIDRQEAIRRCTDEHVKMYYKTLDEYWLHECWNEVEKNMLLPGWEEFRADCYLYFLDRAQRFSILRNPAGMLAIHVKGLREKLRKEISPNMPLKLLRSTDESMRCIGDYD